MKKCNRCLETKPLSDYYVYSGGKTPGKPYGSCKKCHNSLSRKQQKVVPIGGFTTTEEFPADDFLKFRAMCCAYYDQRRKLWVRATNNWYQQDAYSQLQRHNRLVMVLPPGHIKTTLFAIEYPTWRIMGDRNVRITVVQKNQPEARKLIAAVAERIGDYDYYDVLRNRLWHQNPGAEKAHPMGRFVNPLHEWFRAGKALKPPARTASAPWGADGFRVAGVTSGEKDMTMEAKGIGGQIQGTRADLIILDDIQDPAQAVRSPTDSTEKLRWFKDVILGRVTDYQQVVVLANFFSPDDFVHQLISSNPEFAVVNYPALIPSDPDDELSEKVPLCPEYWGDDTTALDFKRKEVGEQTWFYTWMQEEGDYASSTFDRNALEAAKDPELRLGEIPPGVTDLFLGVDPAAGSQGYCAMVVWGLNRKTKQRYLIDLFNEKGMRTWNNVIAQIAEFARMYPLRKVVVEGNNTQRAGLTEDPQFQKQLRSLGTRWETYISTTGTGARSVQTNFDITTIGGLFDVGLVTIPAGGDMAELERLQFYTDQLVAWRTDNEGRSLKHLVRDLVMATLFAESEAFVIANRADRPPMTPRPVPRWVRKRWDALAEHATVAREGADEEALA